MVLNDEKMDIIFYRVISVLEVFGVLNEEEMIQLFNRLNEFYLQINQDGG